MSENFSNPIDFIVGKNELYNFDEGEKKCYLLTNELGGFSSLTALGSCSRHDHGLFISSKKAPNYRVHTVTNLEEKIIFKNRSLSLYNQQFATRTSNSFNGENIEGFEFKYFPLWTYKVSGIELLKDIVMLNRRNTVAIRYRIYSHSDENCVLNVTPLFRLTEKESFPSISDEIVVNSEYVENKTTDNRCYYKTNGSITVNNTEFCKDMFFEYDSRDGRDCIGQSFKGVDISFKIDKPYSEYYIVFSTEKIDTSIDINKLFSDEVERQKKLIERSKLKNSVAQSLVLASDKFISDRESTGGKTIMAGYPFFADWGRDTMISMLGCVLATNRFDDAKSMLRTFAAYEKNGMMPNMFPEGENDEPIYNTVDASLLFIDAVYRYYIATDDIFFVREVYRIMCNIISSYKKGTDFHIKMDSDGLITAGAGLEQLTWMDVRFGDILPTPRQGKAVEINAYWYNALRIMDILSEKLSEDREDYYKLAENKVKPQFLKLFWNEEKECLRDVISNIPNKSTDEQIRPNQVWALSMPFTMIDDEKAGKILSVIYRELYTPFGLRSLSPTDTAFKASYGGSHFNRDMAYHQGTVWGFPLGAYYLSVIRFLPNGREIVARQIKMTASALNEGCLGQIAEIYDGLNPHESQGCFAQGWSVGEILRVYKALEE